MVRSIRTVLSIFATAALTLAAHAWTAEATDFHWNNSAGGLWSEPTNWDPAGPPTLADRAFVDLPGTYTVLVDLTGEAKETYVGAGTGAQTLRLENASFEFQDSLVVYSLGRLEIVASTATGPWTRSLGSMLLTGAQFTGPLVNQGTILTHEDVNADTVTNVVGASIRVEPLSNLSATFQTTSLDNAGLIELVLPTGLNATSLAAGGPFTNRPRAGSSASGAAAQGSSPSLAR